MRRSKVFHVGVGNLAVPVNSVAPVLSGTTTQGQVLSVTNGTWSNTPTGYNYVWKANGVTILGATLSTYTLTSAEVGKTITCYVQAYNLLGNGAATPSNILGPIAALGADVTAPLLSSPTGVQTGSSTANIGATTNEGNGTFYWIVSLSATPPATGKIILGTDASGPAPASGSAAVASTGAKVFAATGLLSNTTYYAHLVQKDAANNPSNVVSSAPFTTATVSSITAPIYARTSAAGGAPLTFSLTFDATVTPSDFIRVEYATNNAKNADGSYVTAVYDSGQQIIGANDWERGDEALVGFTTPSANTPYFIQARIERDNGEVSPWSNEGTDTIVASVAKLVTVTGVNKSRYEDVASPFFQWIHNNNIGNLCGVRADRAAQPAKHHIEETCDAILPTSGRFFMGYDNGDSPDMNVAFSGVTLANLPGNGTNAGFTIQCVPGSATMTYYSNGASHTATLPNAWAAGDTLGIDADQDANTFAVSYCRGTTVTFIVTISLTTSALTKNDMWAFGGGARGDSTPKDTGTFNYGASAWKIPPATGFDHPYA